MEKVENKDMITLELLNEENKIEALGIEREDADIHFVDSVEDIIELTKYGNDHNCIGHTFIIRYDNKCVGIILMGEGIPWKIDPPQINGRRFYRIMGFIIDKAYRCKGIGSYVLEETIKKIYDEFGSRPIVMECHKENLQAMKLYLKHGFQNTYVMDKKDYFLVREIDAF